MIRQKTILMAALLLLLVGCGGSSSSPNPPGNGVVNSAPVVNAGSDQAVTSAQAVSLSGSASDSDGSIVSWQWSQLSGTTVTLSNADQASAAFTAPTVTVTQVLSFQLTVMDDDGASASATVSITVNPLNTSVLPAFGPDPAQCPLTLADRGAAVIHVCDCQSGADASCVAGSDANAGTAAAPKQTIAAAVSAFTGGSDLAFCRGGVWNEATTLKLRAGACSSASPCTVQDYGDGNLAAPLIQLNQTGSNNGLEIAPGDDITRWEGLRIHNLHLAKNSADGQGFGVFLFRNVNDVQMRCLEVNNYGIGVHVNANGLSTGDITLSDSSIHDNGAQGWLGGANRALVERNRFDNNGGYNASMLLHNVYLSGIGDSSVVRGNWLTNSAVDGNGQCIGASMIAHNAISTNLLIEGNLIEESTPAPGCWGLMVDAAGSTTEGHSNAIIRGNVVRNVGNQSIGVSACVDCIIENNIVVQTKTGGSIGISSPNRATSAPDTDVTGTIVRNNTVYFAGSGNGRSYYIGERGANYVVTNNIGYHANALAGDSCFDFDLVAGAYDTVNSNLCFGASFDSGTTGMDGMASTADPLFLNAPDDLRIDDTSPAYNSGSTVSAASSDMLGNVRDANPDRGAYEAQ